MRRRSAFRSPALPPFWIILRYSSSTAVTEETGTNDECGKELRRGVPVGPHLSRQVPRGPSAPGFSDSDGDAPPRGQRARRRGTLPARHNAVCRPGAQPRDLLRAPAAVPPEHGPDERGNAMDDQTSAGSLGGDAIPDVRRVRDDDVRPDQDVDFYDDVPG